jgi:hypothetical protein
MRNAGVQAGSGHTLAKASHHSPTRIHPQLRKSTPAASSTAQRTEAPPSGTRFYPMIVDSASAATLPGAQRTPRTLPPILDSL